jgi:hypothetical protein
VGNSGGTPCRQDRYQWESEHCEVDLSLSGYFSAFMLLYRYLVPNTHRPSALEGTEAVRQCVRAATNCIRLTPSILEALPVCPDLIFHAQHVFAGAMILLHCVRRSEDQAFIQDVLKDTELALHSLRSLQCIWPEARKLIGLLEKYLELILRSFEKGINPGKCLFHHEANELTGLEWTDDFEPWAFDWTGLDFAGLLEPGAALGSNATQTPPTIGNCENNRRRGFSRTSSQNKSHPQGSQQSYGDDSAQSSHFREPIYGVGPLHAVTLWDSLSPLNLADAPAPHGWLD